MDEKTISVDASTETEEVIPVNEQNDVIRQDCDENAAIEKDREAFPSEENQAEADADHTVTDVKKKKKRKKLHEINFLNDLRYKAPLSYRHLRIIAWFLIIVAQVGALLTFATRIFKGMPASTNTIANICSFGGSLTLPLFLLAAFAIILNAKDGYKKLLISYGALSLLIFLVTLFVYFHYFVGLLNAFFGNEANAKELFDSAVSAMLESGFATFNIFVDLFLCALFNFFLNYTPKKKFKGNKIIIFRLFAILPLLYEVASLALKVLASTGYIVMPLYVFSLLTTKPPITFLVFVAMALFIKIRERKFVKKGGKTVDEYHEFLKTNANSLHFSVFTAILFVIAAVVDALILFGVPLIFTPVGTPYTRYLYLQNLEYMFNWGIGRSTMLIFIAPLVLLFSYTKTHKKPLVDLLIPLAGVGIVIFMYIESAFYFICQIPNLAA